MSAAFTPEQTRVLAVLDVVREAIATGQEMEVQAFNSTIWTPASVDVAVTLRANKDYVFRIKLKPEVFRYRVALYRTVGGLRAEIVYSEENEGYWHGSTDFLGWAGPWQEVDVSTLTKE